MKLRCRPTTTRLLLHVIVTVSCVALLGWFWPSDGLAASTRRTPSPETLPGTTPTGVAAFLGPIQRIPANGVELAFRRFGQGPDLVLAIGQGLPMTGWDLGLLQLLARSWRVTVFDYRGVGASTTNRQKLTIPLMARDMSALISALGLRHPTVVGWSMGGEVALALLALHPSAVRKVVVSGATPGGREEVPPSPEVERELASPNTSPQQLLDLLFPATADAAKSSYTQTFIDVPQEQISPAALSAQSAAEERFARTELVWNALPRLGRKLVVTVGAQDQIVPPANGQRIARRARVPAHIFSDAGHALLFQEPERFAALLAG